MLNKKLGQLQTTSREATAVLPEMWARSRGEEDFDEAGAPHTYPPPVHRQQTYGGGGYSGGPLGSSLPHMGPRRAWTTQAGEISAAAAGGYGRDYDSMIVGTPGPHDALTMHSQTAGGSRRPSTFRRPVTPGGRPRRKMAIMPLPKSATAAHSLILPEVCVANLSRTVLGHTLFSLARFAHIGARA